MKKYLGDFGLIAFLLTLLVLPIASIGLSSIKPPQTVLSDSNERLKEAVEESSESAESTESTESLELIR